MVQVTNYDPTHCHKWALLLNERKEKLNKIIDNLNLGKSSETKQLFNEIFYGCSGKKADPGMAGSLLYHMAMVTKMEAEAQVLLKQLNEPAPNVESSLQRFFDDFSMDANELTRTIALRVNPKVVDTPSLTSKEKIALFNRLNQKTKTIASELNDNPELVSSIKNLFNEWADAVAEMRFRQEYQTIRGLLTLIDLEKKLGIPHLESLMQKVQDSFGKETVNIALDVTLKVGLQREKLQSVMLSDHYIDYIMSIDTLDGRMTFLNCPIFGGHKYIGKKLEVSSELTSLFCKHFCFAHAKAMLETVLPFTFELTQPKLMNPDGKCEYYLQLGYSPEAKSANKFIPLVVSWNVTRRCNLKCSHCYINATTNKLENELNTAESKRLIDQIAQVSRPLLILSGGEPLLRNDIYEIIRYGTEKGLRMGLGSNGGLLDANAAIKLFKAGVKTVSISLDSHISSQHDEFRGVEGSWSSAINAVKVLRENDILVQVNTTLTQQNYGQIDEIMSLAEQIGVENYHLFFLVPTGRGAKIADISPEMYEDIIKTTFAKTGKHKLNVRPSCAPQFMRIAKNMGLDMRQWIRGCIAGMYYCRVYPNGDITPCPYLPMKLGNVRKNTFEEIWFDSPVFQALRNPNRLRGKCGACEYKTICGGCRARAYGLSSDFIDYCGDLHEPVEPKGDYLAEDPWCVYQPEKH